ncbi:MAG TPA: DUF2867 domain-containing protein [Flavisolibacter sp.]|nr:DUF2867 domain-containing protein [Flavisolibacter sp.]
MYVTKISISKDESILTILPRLDYADAYCGSFQRNAPITIEDMAYAFFDNAPAWISWLVSLRNSIVKVFGLKTVSATERMQMRRTFQLEVGQTIGLFTILKKQEQEMWVGDDDKHLNYRVALQLKQPALYKYEIVFITAVVLHSWLGRIYFLPVKFFHRIVVKAMLKNTIKTLLAKSI